MVGNHKGSGVSGRCVSPNYSSVVFAIQIDFNARRQQIGAHLDDLNLSSSITKFPCVSISTTESPWSRHYRGERGLAGLLSVSHDVCLSSIDLLFAEIAESRLELVGR